MPNSPLIIGLGEILWDMLPAGRQLGGAPANFAYHAGALGARAAVVSRVGNDPLGREILQKLDELQLDRTHVSIDDQHPTGVVDVTLDAAGVPSYVIRTGVAWDFLPHDAGLMELASRADAVCFGTLGQRSPASRQSIGAFLDATGRQCLRVFDINLRQHYYSRELVVEMMQTCDVLKLNDQELPVVVELLGLHDSAPPDAARAILREFPVRLIALTRGPAGSVLYPRGGESADHPGFPGVVADTVGAGDAFTAALVTGILGGRVLEEINTFANRLAAYVCSMPGATPPIPAALADNSWRR
jgi:fructokinase